jgi:hemerythrin-like domain-containing protein
MIRAHIAKEDNVLFNMADFMVRGPACHQLCAGYEQADSCRFEQRTKAELEALAERLVGSQGGGRG